MNQNKGWRFTGNERKYIEEVLSSGFGASESTPEPQNINPN